MSDQTSDQSLSGTPDDSDALAGTVFEKPVDPATVKPFDFDELLSEGRLVERHAVICLRGDLEAEWVTLIDELSGLVNDDGDPVNTDAEASLGDTQRVEEINARLAVLHKERLAASRRITFRAMPAEEFETWDKSHRGSNDEIKNQKAYFEQLISKCAITPTLTVEQVRQMRSTNLTKNQMVTLANTAYWANTTGGIDVPKLPGFSHALTQPESSLS